MTLPSTAEISSRIDNDLLEVSKRSAREREILDAGRQLLGNEGFAKFSLRRVASDVGVHLRTVQHYFKTKDILVTEVLLDTTIYYRRMFENSVNKNDISAEKRFAVFIDYLLSGFNEKETAGFFLQLWAHAHHHAGAASILEQMHNFHIGEILRFMDAMNLGISNKRRNERAAIIIAMAEGVTHAVSYSKQDVAGNGSGAVVEEVRAMAYKMATEP